MTPADLSSRYREYAAKCIALAQDQDGQSDKLWLLNMAQSWIDLADQVLKNEHLPIVYETPDG